MRFEQEKLSTQTVQRRNKRAERSFPGFFRVLSLFSLEGFWDGGVRAARKKFFREAKRGAQKYRVSEGRRMSTSEETDGLRPRYGCKFTHFPAHLEMPAASLSAGKRAPAGTFCPCTRQNSRKSLIRCRAPTGHFCPRQRGCSLIMTSAFYNMAEEREEGGLLLEFSEPFPLWINSYGSSPMWPTESPLKCCLSLFLPTTNSNL